MRRTSSRRLPPHLHLRGTTYYLRIAVPARFRSLLGRAELWRSLKTRHLQCAKARSAAAYVRIDALWQRLDMAVEDPSVDFGHISRLANQWLREALDEHKLGLSAGQRFSPLRGGKATIEDLEAEEEVIATLCSDAREELALGDYSRATQAARELLPGVNEDNASFKLLCRELAERRVAYFEVAAARVMGDVRKEREVITRWAPASLDHVETKDSASLKRFSSLAEAYVQDKRRAERLEARSAAEYEAASALFIDICGDLTMAELNDREVFFRFADALKVLPANRKKRKPYRDHPVEDLLTMEIPAGDRMAPRTIEKQLTRISSMLKWGVREGWLERNRAEGISPSETGSAKRAYDDSELAKLFSPTNYRRNEEPHKFWLPLLGLFTGCRLAELVQLTVDDIQEREGVPLIQLVDDEEAGKRLKGRKGRRKAARRVVPLHRTLIDLGFLRFVKTRAQEALDAKLFPEIAGEDRDARNRTATKWYRRFRVHCGVDSVEVDFHSFRRTVVTRLNGANKPLLFIQELIGHERKNITQDTYHHGSPPAQLQDVIESLEYELPFEELKQLSPTGHR